MLSGGRKLCGTSLSSTAATGGTATSPALATGETATTTALAAGASGLVSGATATATAGASPAGVVVATAVCVGLWASLLDVNALAVNRDGALGDGGGVASLGLELDKGTILETCQLSSV